MQIVGAAERKPRAPNEMLQRVTDRRLAEADRRVLHGVCKYTLHAVYIKVKQQMNSRHSTIITHISSAFSKYLQHTFAT